MCECMCARERERARMSVISVSALCTLGAWWSVWTLADFYLIRFTPWSELIILLACAVLSLAHARLQTRPHPPLAENEVVVVSE